MSRFPTAPFSPEQGERKDDLPLIAAFWLLTTGQRRSWIKNFVFVEIRSLPTLAHCYPRSFTFYVAHPIRSIHVAWILFNPKRWTRWIPDDRRRNRWRLEGL